MENQNYALQTLKEDNTRQNLEFEAFKIQGDKLIAENISLKDRVDRLERLQINDQGCKSASQQQANPVVAQVPAATAQTSDELHTQLETGNRATLISESQEAAQPASVQQAQNLPLLP